MTHNLEATVYSSSPSQLDDTAITVTKSLPSIPGAHTFHTRVSFALRYFARIACQWDIQFCSKYFPAVRIGEKAYWILGKESSGRKCWDEPQVLQNTLQGYSLSRQRPTTVTSRRIGSSLTVHCLCWWENLCIGLGVGSYYHARDAHCLLSWSCKVQKFSRIDEPKMKEVLLVYKGLEGSDLSTMFDLTLDGKTVDIAYFYNERFLVKFTSEINMICKDQKVSIYWLVYTCYGLWIMYSIRSHDELR